MRVCDGCGALADDQHLRERIKRLELATRYRPVHIHVLLVTPAPPSRIEDYFYGPEQAQPHRSRESCVFFDQLVRSGDSGPERREEKAALADFQRRGLFLIEAVECPVTPGEIHDAVRELTPTLLKRIQFSYRPKWVALLEEPSRQLVSELQAAGWGDRLLLDDGAPFLMEKQPHSQTEAPEVRLAAALAGLC